MPGVLAFLIALPVCVADRPHPEAKAAQLATIAAAIELATPEPEERAALVTIAWFESRLCLAVHAGRVRGGTAEGLWQIEPGSHRRRPYAGLSELATEHAAGEALWLWRHAGNCRSGLPARFRGYAGLGCGPSSWKGAAPRAAFMWRTLAYLRKPEPRWYGKALALAWPAPYVGTDQTLSESTTYHTIDTWCGLLAS